LGQIDLGFTQLPDNLLRGMSLLGHLRLLPGSRILTSLLDRFQGAGSIFSVDLESGRADATQRRWMEADKADDYVTSGIEKRERGDLAGAIVDYTKAIELKPDYPIAYFYRGLAWQAKKKYDKAIADYTQAIKLRPDLALTYKLRGMTHYVSRSWKNGLADFRKAASLKPKNSDYARIFTWLCRTRLGEGPFATLGLREYLGQRQAGEDSDWTLATIFFLTDRFSEEELQSKAASNDEETKKERQCEAFYYLGFRRLMAGEKEAAVEYFRKCVGTGVENYAVYQAAVGELEVLRKQR
ncbi:MAG: tetratricopeptide repeat protein, partial [Planctomycetota bacterium]|nr:tetratricopeptide repeat protein [Planctomycetota bacterium]